MILLILSSYKIDIKTKFYKIVSGRSLVKVKKTLSGFIEISDFIDPYWIILDLQRKEHFGIFGNIFKGTICHFNCDFIHSCIKDLLVVFAFFLCF